MELPAELRAVWQELLEALPGLRAETSPVPKLAGSAYPQWFVLADASPRLALRPTPAALEIWAGQIGDASTCFLIHVTGAETADGLLAQALGDSHPLSACFVIRILVPDAGTLWPAKPLLQATEALRPLSGIVRSLDLYPKGIGATLAWEAATPGTVRAAMEACATFVDAVGRPSEDPGPFRATQTVFEGEGEEEEPDEGAEDGSTGPVRGYRARFARGLLGLLPPVALKWTAALGLTLAGFATLALLRNLALWASRAASGSLIAPGIFALVCGGMALAVLHTLQRCRAGSPSAWTEDHHWPTGGPLQEDWKRDAALRLLIAVPCLLAGFAIMTPGALDESEAPCFNVGLGIIGMAVGAYHLLRMLILGGRVLRWGPAQLWLEPYPPRPGAAFGFRVHVPGRQRLPGLHATLRGHRPRMVEGDEGYQLHPYQCFLRSVALDGPVAEPEGWGFRGRFSLPAQAPSSAHSACPGTFWDLTIHGPRERRHPDLCFLIPVYAPVPVESPIERATDPGP